ncbi:MAG: hypothetical protein Q8881_02060, partial [Sweet potato little leaf phytoplasma]|nr:hypothetical protein [Sweet potato little leaf phytoplasma]
NWILTTKIIIKFFFFVILIFQHVFLVTQAHKKNYFLMFAKQLMLILFSLMVSGELEETMVDLVFAQHDHSLTSLSKQEENHHQQQQQQLWRRSRLLFDIFFSSKRKVPNASDPLHNR